MDWPCLLIHRNSTLCHVFCCRNIDSARTALSILALQAAFASGANVIRRRCADLLCLRSARDPDVRPQSGHPIEADGITEWIRALGAAGLIIASLNAESIRRVLLSPLIQSLGKMSYSIYLLHMIVMLFLVHTLYTRMPLPLIFAISFVCTLALSWISYTRIEVPFNTLGHRLTRRSMSPDPIGPTAVSREIACGIEEEVVTASESANLN
jgi:hypothetical protein